MASLKRSPSPTEDSAPEQQPRKRRPLREKENPADDEADSADGSNSMDSTPTTTDHPDKTKNGMLKTQREPPDKWKIHEPFHYCNTLIPNIYCLMYPDLSDTTQYIYLILKRIINVLFTGYDLNSGIRKIYIKKHEEMTLLLSEEHKIKVRKKNQYAFFFFRRKDGTFTKPFGPYFPKDGGNVHSEDLVCTEIQDLGNQLTEYSELYIYTVNSPCKGRKNTEPCMIRLISLSDRLGRDYGIETYVTFSKYYGSTGSVCKCLPYHTYKKCSYGADSPPLENNDYDGLALAGTRILTKPDRQSQFLMKMS
ncbi:hypothetical protein NFI96_032697, partial [Prochilodus magdalenae]